MNPLTDKQARILEAIISHQQLFGQPAGLNTIARWFGFTRNAARDHCLALTKKRYLTHANPVGESAETWQMRPFRLTQKARDWFANGAVDVGVLSNHGPE